LGPFFVGIVALLLAFSGNIKNFFTRPKLKLDYEGEAANVVPTQHPEDGQLFSVIYVKPRIRNLGQRVAKNCRVYLTNIQKVHTAGCSTSPTAFYDARVISWPLRDFKPRDIPKTVDFYIDVVRVYKEKTGWYFGIKGRYASLEELNTYSGTYRLTLVATAENANPAKLVIDITYDNKDLNSLKVAVVPTFRHKIYNWLNFLKKRDQMKTCSAFFGLGVTLIGVVLLYFTDVFLSPKVLRVYNPHAAHDWLEALGSVLVIGGAAIQFYASTVNRRQYQELIARIGRLEKCMPKEESDR
jgi:hypothetical protein